MNATVSQKTCTKCKVLKPISEFRNDKRLKSGVGSRCKACSNKDALDWNNANKEHYLQQQVKWRKDNLAYDSARKMQWAKDNPINKKEADARTYYKHAEKRKEAVRQRYTQVRPLRLQYSQQWRKNNMGYILAKNAERRARKLQQSPSWVSNEERKAITSLYAQSKAISAATGVLHHVDHIIPLHGRLVSGLHVLNNLQIIPWYENLSKRNKFLPV